MDNNRKYVEEDVLGVPADNEADAKFKAREQLEFLKKTCIRILDANRVEGRSTYNVNVEYVDAEDYQNIEGKIKDTIYVPSSTETDAIHKAIEALEFQKKKYINVSKATKRENKDNYAVEVEYVEEGTKNLK